MYFGIKKREKWISKIRNEMKKIEKKIERLGLGLTRRRHCSRRARVGPVQELTDLKKVHQFFTKYSWIWKFSRKKFTKEICQKVFSVLGTLASQPFFPALGHSRRLWTEFFLFLFLYSLLFIFCLLWLFVYSVYCFYFS